MTLRVRSDACADCNDSLIPESTLAPNVDVYSRLVEFFNLSFSTPSHSL